jgi:hypothetical protein
MGLNSVKFTCTSLAGTNKVGLLQKDANGYFKIVLGALNVYNSAGQFYVFEQAKELFVSSSALMRRVQRGVLRSELGHPKKLPGMSDDAFAHRCLSIYEENVCAHIKSVELDFENVKDQNGRPVIAIVGWVCPSGPNAASLERSLNNPDENVCFSIRAFTDDFREQGIVKRILRQIVTWDYVNEPGISVAEKYKSPGLEEYNEVVTRGQLERAIASASMSGMAHESELMTANELFTSMGWSIPAGGNIARPAYMDW